MTYSIVARCPHSGALGVAVQSHFFAVGRVVAHAEAGVGAVATQSIIEPAYGPGALALLREGASPAAALDALLAADPDAAGRQVGVVAADGEVAVRTGAGCIALAGDAVGPGVAVQANLMCLDTAWEAMLAAFTASEGPLPWRMMRALEAAERQGGDLRGRQSAAMLVVAGQATGRRIHDVLVDVRVDDHADPLGELARLLRIDESYGGLLRLFEVPGLLQGPGRADAAAVSDAERQLLAAERALGPANREPAVWLGVLLHRDGRPDEAERALARAAEVPGLAELIVRFRRSGVLPAA